MRRSHELHAVLTYLSGLAEKFNPHSEARAALLAAHWGLASELHRKAAANRIIAYVGEHPGCSALDVHRACAPDLNPTRTQSIIHKLVSEGRLVIRSRAKRSQLCLVLPEEPKA
jgi:hypothetical protein